jgi:hypothetical protein
MPAFDQCHEQVVHALQKEQWQVVKAPLRVQVDSRVAYIDVEMARGANGSREYMLLAEIKCLSGQDATTTELYEALGQYLVYRAMIFERSLPHSVYLAVPESEFNAIFDVSVMRVVNESQIRIVVVNLETERLVKWIETQP